MNLLLDENISWRCIKKLEKRFEKLEHVSNLPGKPLKDMEIWDYARRNNFAILTYDNDFGEIASLRGSPPKIILLKFGNNKADIVARKIIDNVDLINEFAKDDNYSVLEIY